MPPRRKFIPTPDVPPDAAADHRARLIQLRDRLTAQLDAAPAAYVAGLARQLQSVLSELAGLRDPDAPPSKLDEIIARREARRADAGFDAS